VQLGSGADRYRGLAGDDVIRGGVGPDRLVGGAGRDKLIGQLGGDRLDARDGRADRRVAGGPGRDVCLIDARDRARVSGCEVVKAPGVPSPGAAQPPQPQLSDAYLNRNWQPTPYDTCSKALHDSYSVVGPDGKLYPTWHPPAVTDPATGQPCTFGHEHGADPASSDIYAWVAAHQTAPGFEDRAGIPFGLANEALAEQAAGDQGAVARFEDHVGHKVEVADDVTLLDEAGAYVYTQSPDGGTERVVCDHLMKVHQGSHSPDATTNNVHELLYAVRCNDGTELISTILSRFGAGGEFNRSCAPGAVVDTGASPYPAGQGARLIPDRGCIEQYVLVPPASPGAQSDIWALYENWISDNELRAAGGELLARFDPWFAVRNPARYQWPGASTPGRTVDAAWETDPSDGGVANRPPWTTVGSLGPFEYRDPRSPFDGAERDFYLQDTEVVNADGPRLWWTDAYGENGSPSPFPGGICQIVAGDNSERPPLKRRLFERDTDYGGSGVHAPN
jgi:hypothetical protein